MATHTLIMHDAFCHLQTGCVKYSHWVILTRKKSLIKFNLIENLYTGTNANTVEVNFDPLFFVCLFV